MTNQRSQAVPLRWLLVPATLLVATAVAIGAVVRSQQATEAAREVEVRAAVDAFAQAAEAAHSASNASTNPCDGARTLAAFVTANPRPNVRSADLLAEVRAALDDRLSACCAWRLDELRRGLGNLNASPQARGSSRAEMLAVIGGVHEMAEGHLLTFDRCDAGGVLDQLAVAVIVERAHELRVAEWRSFARIVESDAGGRADIGELLFSAERRRELALLCIRSGISDAQRTSRSDHESALAMCADVASCIEHAPSDVVTDRDRTRLAEARSAAMRRAEQSEAEETRENERVYREALRRERAAATSCMRSCVRRGTDAWDCADDCARRHPSAVDPLTSL